MFSQVQMVSVLLLICVFNLNGVTSRGKWVQHYDYQFPFEVDGRHYFYAQSIENDGNNYFIQELKAGGEMGDETDAGLFIATYPTVFPYSIGGKQYFFGQSRAKNYFTQELLPGGKLGDEKAHGYFNQYYEVMFPFSIGGRQFFYGQSRDGNNYFFQELYGDGTLAKYETTQGRWQNFYDIQFAVSNRGNHYFYGQSRENNYYFIQQLNEDGTPGDETAQGLNSGNVQFPFYYRNTPFIYIEDGLSWYTAEITAAGKLVNRRRAGPLNHHHDFGYEIGGDVFLYGQDSNNEWIINNISPCIKNTELDRRHYAEYRLSTWNMQGANSNGDNKWLTIVEGELLPNFDLVALQESGAYPTGSTEENLNPADETYIDHIGLFAVVTQRVWHLGTTSRPRDAFIYHIVNGIGNDRTSMAIVSHRAADEVIVIGPVRRNNRPDVGPANRASRPILGIRRGNDYFFNIHAGAHPYNEALNAVEDIESHMSEILETNPEATWIIMGDFNRDGDRIEHQLRFRPPPDNAHRGFSIPYRNTHHSNTGDDRILDFAITGSGLDNDVRLISQSSDRTDSDHSVVTVEGLHAFILLYNQFIRNQCG